MSWAWHIHHDTLYGVVLDPGLEARRAFIRTDKPRRQRARRLRLMKLVERQVPLTKLHEAIRALVRPTKKQELAAVRAVQHTIRQAITRLHALECPKCPWNGKTIFPRKAK